jgi:hypothetical protein
LPNEVAQLGQSGDAGAHLLERSWGMDKADVDKPVLKPQISPDTRAEMYSVVSIKACEFRTTDCFDVPLNQSIIRGDSCGAFGLFGER